MEISLHQMRSLGVVSGLGGLIPPQNLPAVVLRQVPVLLEDPMK